MDEPENIFDEMARTVSIDLAPVGGRVIVSNARTDRENAATILLKCWWKPFPFLSWDKTIRIGHERHKPIVMDYYGRPEIDNEGTDQTGWNLSDCPIEIRVEQCSKAWLQDVEGLSERDRVAGHLNYWGPRQSDDGVVNEKRPIVSIGLVFGAEQFALLQNRLLEIERPDFEIVISVRFPQEAVDKDWARTNVKWDGKGALPVPSASIIWTRADWDSSYDISADRSLQDEDDDDVEVDLMEDAAPSDLAQLLSRIARIEAKLAALAIPLWIAAIGAGIAAWRLS